MSVITTVTCTRCMGNKYYPMPGYVCWRCAGSGFEHIAPKGQKKIKPTADVQTCKVGDIISINRALYIVVSIRWAVGKSKGNQHITMDRMVDNTTMYYWRTWYATDNDGTTWRVVMPESYHGVEVTEENTAELLEAAIANGVWMCRTTPLKAGK